MIGIDSFHNPDPISTSILTLSGKAQYSDIAQDFYGSRALILRLDPYPPLNEAFKTLGIIWDVAHESTHPPTDYLLTIPVAFLPWPIASALWGWLMVAAIIFSLCLYGFSWRWAIIITIISLIWSPVSFSLGQLTPIWLLGLALANHNRENPFMAGIWIAFAALTKFLPAILLIPFLLRRKWSALISFIAIWLIALGLITILHPEAILRYLEINSSNSFDMITRLDNGALLPSLARFTNWPGVVVGMIFLALVGWYGRDNWHTWEFLAVALLPIAWIYSLLPLLPGLIQKRKNKFLVLSLILSVITPPFGISFASYMPIILILYSVSLLPIPIQPFAFRN